MTEAKYERPAYQRITYMKKKPIENRWELLWWMVSHSWKDGSAIARKPTYDDRKWTVSKSFSRFVIRTLKPAWS